MTPPDQLPLFGASCRGLTAANDSLRSLLILALLVVVQVATITDAQEKPAEVYFSGKLIELDAPGHTFVIQSKKKQLVFTIDVHRCDITVDGSISERSLRFARIGDAVIGELSLKHAKPEVIWVEFTHKPQIGKAVHGKPGFILSPYLPRWPQPGYQAEAMDARQLAHGDMVLDDGCGKIFLVP